MSGILLIRFLLKLFVPSSLIIYYGNNNEVVGHHFCPNWYESNLIDENGNIRFLFNLNDMSICNTMLNNNAYVECTVCKNQDKYNVGYKVLNNVEIQNTVRLGQINK